MRSFVLSVLLLLLAGPQLSFAKSKLKKQHIRRFDRSTVKLVRIDLNNKRLILHWKAPSGRVIPYQTKRTTPGLLFKLKRYIKQGYSRVAVGGNYRMNNAKAGQVEPEFAYRVKRVWRGAQVVKLDGWMPLFHVTRLPTPQQPNTMIYELRGIINTAMANRDNKLVCLYGTWFDLVDYIHPRTQRRRGMVNQIEGIKGQSLYFFPKAYKHPRSWHHMIDQDEKMKAYKLARRRMRKGLSSYNTTIRIPLVPQKSINTFDKQCQKRMSPLERKLSYKPISPESSNVVVPTRTKTPITRKAAPTIRKAAPIVRVKVPVVRRAAPIVRRTAPIVRRAVPARKIAPTTRAKAPVILKAPTTRPTARR